jgi:flagellar hook protein FlgE
MQRGYQIAGNAANTIARQNTVEAGGNGDLARPLVDLTVGARQSEASASVIRTADDMVGTLLDVMA